jgi:hypothetical protein
MRFGAWLPTLLATLAVLTGCSSGYSGRFDEVRLAIERNRISAASERIDQLVAKASGKGADHPEDLPLLLLERASIRQAAGNHRGAIEDFTTVDPMIEVIDLTPEGASSAAEYFWSDDAGLYKLPIYEKLMVNVSAMASYLAVGDVQGALVESRRIDVMTSYYQNTPLAEHPMIGAAHYLIGLANEIAGRNDAALRYYLDAAKLCDAADLDATIARLGRSSTLRNNERVQQAVAATKGATEVGQGEGRLVSIVLSGLPPYRVAERMPIGLAVNAFRRDSRYPMSDAQEAAYARATAEDLLTWVNYPRLVRGSNRLTSFSLAAPGAAMARTVEVANVEDFAIAEWESNESAIAWAAVTRAITRIVAREVVQDIGRAVDSGNGGATTQIFWLLGLATQGAMQAADVPDTRTWSTMPARISIARTTAAEGPRQVTVRSDRDSFWQTLDTEVIAGETSVVVARFLD